MTLHLLNMKKLPRDISTLVFNTRVALIFLSAPALLTYFETELMLTVHSEHVIEEDELF